MGSADWNPYLQWQEEVIQELASFYKDAYPEPASESTVGLCSR